MANLLHVGDYADIVAIADVDSAHADRANQKFTSGKAYVCKDYREILDRSDVDMVLIATPDHWHTKPLIEAMLAGKDAYCEKPLTLTIDEGKLIREVVNRTGQVVQVGTQQRSTSDFIKAIALVADGRLGKIQKIQAAIGSGLGSPSIPAVKVPETLDWDRWIGPAPFSEYRWMKEGSNEFTNGHYNFRWWYDYSGGKLTDWGAHHVDIATWALQASGVSPIPVSLESQASHPVPFKDGYPTQNDRYNTATNFSVNVTYPSGAVLTINGESPNGVLIEGDRGRIFVNRKKLVGKTVEQLAEQPLPEDAMAKVYKNFPKVGNGRAAHWPNFFHCCRERVQPISDVHSHMTALNTCHLAAISCRLGRSLQWDGKSEEITGDEQANSFLARPYREGYAIEM